MSPLDKWSIKQIPSVDIASLDYGNGTLVAVGLGGVVLTSGDGGNTWSPGQAPAGISLSDTWLTDVACGATKVVACGWCSTGGTIISVIWVSTNNGMSWIAASLPNYELKAVASCQDTFVVVGRALLYSNNVGGNWTVSPCRLIDPRYLDVCNSDGLSGRPLFVAVGMGNRSACSAASNDGVTWNELEWNVTNAGWILNSVAYGNGIFVAVGSKGNGGILSMFFTSTDGINWTQVPYATSDELTKISFAVNTFVAVGTKGYVYDSLDGQKWNVRQWSGTLDGFGDIHFAASKFNALAARGTLYQSAEYVQPSFFLKTIAAGTGSGNCVQVVQLGPKKTAVLTAWQDNTDTWHSGSSLPAIPGGPSLCSLALGNGNSGFPQVLSLGEDGFAYLAAWQDYTGVWGPGGQLPGQAVELSVLTCGNGNCGFLQVLGVGTLDGFAYLAAWQDNTGTWHHGSTVILPHQVVRLSSLACSNGNCGFLQVLGVGAADGFAYLVAWQDNNGIWYRGGILPGQKVKLSELTCGNGNCGFLQVFGLGAVDGFVYLSAWQDNTGTWHHGTTEMLPGQSVMLSSIAVGNGYCDYLYVFGLGPDGHVYMAAWQDVTGTWHPGVTLPTQSVRLSQLAAIRGIRRNLQVIGVGVNDQRAYVACWQDDTGTWQPGSVIS